MKLLLKKDIPTLGIVGDIINVSPGYARNYLLPNDLAMEPTESNMRAIAKERAAAEERRRKAMDELRSRAEKLAQVEVTIPAAANPDGHLYGSVTARDIAAALREQGHDVDVAHVKLAEPIKQLDNVTVPVVLAESIKAEVKVWVVRSSEGGEDEGEGESDETGAEAPSDDGTEAG
jgi:large subunit ribosomal protein L9